MMPKMSEEDRCEKCGLIAGNRIHRADHHFKKKTPPPLTEGEKNTIGRVITSIAYASLEKERDDWKARANKAYERVLELEAELADWKASHKKAIESPCPDEKHCACVPFLREEVKRLKSDSTRVTLYRAENHTVMQVGDKSAILPWPWPGMEPGEKREMILVDKPGQS